MASWDARVRRRARVVRGYLLTSMDAQHRGSGGGLPNLPIEKAICVPYLYGVAFAYVTQLRNVMYASLDSGTTLQGRNAVSHADTHEFITEFIPIRSLVARA